VVPVWVTALDEFAASHGGCRIQRAEARHKKYRRLQNQRLGDRYALLHTSRELMRVFRASALSRPMLCQTSQRFFTKLCHLQATCGMNHEALRSVDIEPKRDVI